ncbi:MAG: hypothetical protein B7X04_01950 [Parcubacteria group bacterium 21-54-25]|nr:MAG: hypothetical protein B7X04_01950 [Parcubacteria group bacterium 21-54-25]HQU07664.1 hypothetical protein [Candidatus Paceibacterota bacterium]
MSTTQQLSRQYAAALMRLGALPGANEATLTKRLITHLRAKGRLGLLPSIVRALKKHAAQTAHTRPLLETARVEDRQETMRAAAQAGLSTPDVVVNETLIRGWRAQVAGVLVDRSAKRALTELYQNLTR